MVSDPKHVCVHLPNWIGDVVMSTPALRALHRRFPEAKITVVGRAVACAVVEGLPYVHHEAPVPHRAPLC